MFIDKMFQGIFYSIANRMGSNPPYRHYRLFRDGLVVFIKAFVLIPAILLQLYYWTTVFGCSSLSWRGHLGSVCGSPNYFASSMEQQVPWYMDLWGDQVAIEPNLRPPRRVKSLLVGYLHVCDSELYLQDYLNEIESISTNRTTNDLHQDLSKCRCPLWRPLRDTWRLG